MKPFLYILTLVFFFSQALHAATYKWVDEDGNVQYSQQPPPSGQYESIKIRPTPRQAAGTGKTGQDTNEFLDKAATQRKDETKIKDEMKKSQELRKKNCETARKQFEFYNVYRRKQNDKGEYERISDDEKATGLKEAQQGIKDFCD